jgi:CMP-N-acetylneuraminic acid synthetase
LTRVKIRQLIASKLISKIIVSTDDPKVKEICKEELKSSKKDYEIVDRPSYLASNEASTDDVIIHARDCITEGSILWTHVTSPFVNEEIYDDAIQKYYKSLKEQSYDSLMSVTKIQKFLFSKDGFPINYNRNVEKWPRTQTLEPIYEVNSAFFIASADIYKTHNDRIGQSPYLYELTESHAFDIDWEDDFSIAETLWSNKCKKIGERN